MEMIRVRNSVALKLAAKDARSSLTARYRTLLTAANRMREGMMVTTKAGTARKTVVS